MIVDVRYVFVLECQVWNQDHTAFLRLLCVFWRSKPMPFAWCLWGFDSLLLASSKSQTQQLGPDRSRYRVRSNGSCWYTYIEEMLDIQHLPSNWSDEKNSKDLLEVVLQQNEYASMLPIQHPEYIILGPIWPFANTLLKYNMWVHDADVVDTLFLAFLHLHPTRLKIKRGDEKAQNQ